MGAPVTTAVRQSHTERPAALADARLAFAILNHARHVTLERVFGIQRNQANLLTVILALSAVDAAYEGARRVAGVRHSFRLRDQRFSILLAREAVYALGGPSAREIPGFPVVVGAAVAASFGLPAMRRVAYDLRRTNHRLREVLALRVGTVRPLQRPTPAGGRKALPLSSEAVAQTPRPAVASAVDAF